MSLEREAFDTALTAMEPHPVAGAGVAATLCAALGFIPMMALGLLIGTLVGVPHDELADFSTMRAWACIFGPVLLLWLGVFIPCAVDGLRRR